MTCVSSSTVLLFFRPFSDVACLVYIGVSAAEIERPLKLPKSGRPVRVAVWNDNESFEDKRKHPGPQNIISCLQHTCWTACQCTGVSRHKTMRILTSCVVCVVMMIMTMMTMTMTQVACTTQRLGKTTNQFTRSCFVTGKAEVKKRKMTICRRCF